MVMLVVIVMGLTFGSQADSGHSDKQCSSAETLSEGHG
ncbi:hypothetical protein KR52_08975 [Synechococcus sp. KORDI-52]|nr:hypothetical protein KR52_08975 [Synechococcus sp. KORDI-52]